MNPGSYGAHEFHKDGRHAGWTSFSDPERELLTTSDPFKFVKLKYAGLDKQQGADRPYLCSSGEPGPRGFWWALLIALAATTVAVAAGFALGAWFDGTPR